MSVGLDYLVREPVAANDIYDQKLGTIHLRPIRRIFDGPIRAFGTICRK